jgi:hypothetical protein
MRLSTLAQEVVIDTNYYAPPPVRRYVLTDDPDQNSDRRRPYKNQTEARRHQLMDQFDELQTWYVSGEGGFRNDGSTLSNSFNGLVSSTSLTKFSWSIVAGYTYRNAWAIEGGYAHAPIHLNITVPNGGVNPLVFNYQNSGHGIPVRVKRRIGSGRKAAHGTGFWLSAGAWLIPNGNSQPDDFHLIGYSSRSRRTTDTLRLNGNTTIANSITGLAEAGIDYAVRLSTSVELGIYIRKYWGLGNALRSNLDYTINNASQQQSSVVADGTGWSFGVALRYIYGRQLAPKKP